MGARERKHNIWSDVLQCNYFVYILWDCVYIMDVCVCVCVFVPSPILYLESDIPFRWRVRACIYFISIFVSSSVRKLKSREKKKLVRWFCAILVTVTTESTEKNWCNWCKTNRLYDFDLSALFFLFCFAF